MGARSSSELPILPTEEVKITLHPTSDFAEKSVMSIRSTWVSVSQSRHGTTPGVIRPWLRMTHVFVAESWDNIS